MGQVLDLYRARVAGGVIEPDRAQEAAALRLDALAEELAAWKPGGFLKRASPTPRGLYLWGAVGRGKSMLMDLFFDAAPVKPKRRVHFHEFMLSQHAFMREARKRRDEGNDALITGAAQAVADKARLLCFDEFAVSDIADAMILGRLFERLMALGVVVVATSNRPPRDLYRNGLNRQLFTPFIDLIEQRLDVVEIAAARDYRLERLMAAPVYYAPLGPAADEAIDNAWSRLTLGAAPHPVVLEVQGRQLTIDRTAAGCARVTFDELCARPLGAADYLELADRFHTVILENIPKLTPAMREEAARFRVLIDALYEAKTKLVASADALPENLYPAGDQSFEFERTVSRLMEMRSEAYLALPPRDRDFREAIVEG
ncbi:MAG: AFG1 family ATPase [Hyphomonadaceae bacterium]|nr:AFG1 family ATPase [Hyphomonadaceae bacterium]